MSTTTECPPHDWEASGIFGVIIGVSKCRECGKTSASKDFEALAAYEQAKGEESA